VLGWGHHLVLHCCLLPRLLVHQLLGGVGTAWVVLHAIVLHLRVPIAYLAIRVRRLRVVIVVVVCLRVGLLRLWLLGLGHSWASEVLLLLLLRVGWSAEHLGV